MLSGDDTSDSYRYKGLETPSKDVLEGTHHSTDTFYN